MNTIFYKGQEKVIFQSGDAEASATNVKLTRADGQLAQLEFTIFDTNPYYEEIALNDLLIADYFNDPVHSFIGVVVSISRSLFGGKTILALSAETLWARVLVTPQKATTRLNAIDYFNALIPFMARSYGNVFDFSNATVLLDPSDTIAPLGYEFTDALSILKMIEENNGIAPMLQYANNKVAVYFRKKSISLGGNITLGVNMLDYADEFALGDIITGVWALGAEDGTYSSGATKYICITQNAGDTVNNIIENPTLVNLYGRNTVAIHFGDITDRNLLRQLATEWLAKNAFAQLSLTVSGLDLNIITGEARYGTVNIGQEITVICQPLGVETTLILQEQTLDFLHPENSVMRLAGKRALSYTQTIQRKLGGLYYD